MQYSRPRIICNGAPPEGEKTPTTYVGAGSLTDAELERLILRETKALKATDTQETEEPRVGVADAVELQPSGPSPNTVPPPISTSRSGTATPLLSGSKSHTYNWLAGSSKSLPESEA